MQPTLEPVHITMYVLGIRGGSIPGLRTGRTIIVIVLIILQSIGGVINTRPGMRAGVLSVGGRVRARYLMGAP